MALSKLSLLNHLTRTLAKPLPSQFHAPPSFLPIRFLSFATPEEAAAERRKRKRRLRIEPPLSAFRQQQQQQPRPSPSPTQNPNAPKLPEPVSALSGNRLTLHNRILKLIRENDLEEAALFTRHSIYSNCRPTIYTCNSVMAAQLRQAKYTELLSLHRFITQAGVAANIVTYNILLSVYLDCRKTDLALEQYKQLINDAPFSPSITTYRILIKGLVDNNQIEKALELKDEMDSKRFDPDPTIYSYLMLGQANNSNPDAVLDLYEELKQKLGTDEITDGVIYGNLMKGYFLKGMETEAMEVYKMVTGEGSHVKMTDIAYNYVLEALTKNGKLEDALNLFEKMKNDHDPPRKLTVNLGSYNLVVDGFCAEKRFDDAVQAFNSMGEKRCTPDTLSYNVLIDQLCSNGKLAEASELYKGMADKKVIPDEYTFVTLMDTCLKEDRPEDAAEYFKTMVESKLRPNLAVYNRIMDGLVRVGKTDYAKSIFDMMVLKLKMDDDAYKFIMNALFENGKHDEVLGIVGNILKEDEIDLTDEVEEFVREGLRKEGREDELADMKAKVEKEKADIVAKAAEEIERAKTRARDAVASLLPSKLLKENNDESESKDGKEGLTVEDHAEVEAVNENGEGSNNVVSDEQVAA